MPDCTAAVNRPLTAPRRVGKHELMLWANLVPLTAADLMLVGDALRLV